MSVGLIGFAGVLRVQIGFLRVYTGFYRVYRVHRDDATPK